MAKTNKFNVPNGIMNQGKTCLEKLKTLLKFLDGTTSLILRSSKRWSMAAAISVGIDETDELMTDEDTLAGSTSTLNGTTKYPRKSKHLYHHWHRSVSDMRNVAKILSIVSARCESTSACSLCSDFSSNVASVDAIPCILVSALQTYHRLTVDVTHFLASTNPRLSRNSTFCNLQDIDSEQDEERPLTTEVIVMTENKQFTTASSNFSHHSGSSYSQPYRFGGRVGLFGHYLRSLKIILLLTCIKLDATTKNGSRNPNSSNQQSQHKVVDHILKGICDLASSIEAVERKYVKKGQRLLFCGPDLISLGSRCIDLQRAFDALHGTVQGGEESSAGCWFACFQENMSLLTSMLRRFEAKQVQILLQCKISSTFQTKERKPSDYKFFCEDIEPVSLIWTKVDEAMLTSSSSAESSFGDQDFDDFSNDDIKTEVMNLT